VLSVGLPVSEGKSGSSPTVDRGQGAETRVQSLARFRPTSYLEVVQFEQRNAEVLIRV
jgi:hypothetical protein